MNKKSLAALTLSVALLVPTLAACNKADKNNVNEHRVLRIASMYGGSDDEYFRQQFTEVFEYANPNIEVQIVPVMDNSKNMYAPPKPGTKPEDPFEKLKEVMAQPNPPDVVMFNYDQLPDLVSSNLLAPLDPLVQKDKFDTSDIVPLVMDGLKSAGDGKLYALAPLFSSNALIYNKAMFDAAGVPYPTDNMTWDQIFDLSRRLSSGDGDKRVYGFSFSSQPQDLFYAMQTYIQPLGIRMMDDNGEKMTVDTDQWEKIWKQFVQLNNEKLVPAPPDYSKGKPARPVDSPFGYDDFMMSRVAMTIMNYGQLTQIINANKNADQIQNYKKIDWDVVTLPSHAENPGVVPFVNLNGIMGINAKAGNPEDAWNFLKFINGEDWAKLKAHSSYQMVAHKKYIKPQDGLNYHIEAFYNVKPTTNVNEFQKFYRDKPNISQVQVIGRNVFQQVLQGQMAVRDGLKQWQTQGNQLLQQIKENPNAPIKPAVPNGA